MMSDIKELEEIGKFLLHVKALIWCLCKAGDRYNLKKITKTVKNRKIPPELFSSTVGQNLSFILSFLSDDADIDTLIEALTAAVHDAHDRHGKKAEVKHPSGVIICEVGHYIEALEEIDGKVNAGNYGVLCALEKDKIKGLFFVPDKGLEFVTCDPSRVRFIFGTTIFSPSMR